MATLRTQVFDRFAEEWPQCAPEHRLVMSRLREIYDRFVADGLADPHFERQLLGPTHAAFSQRLGELLLAHQLRAAGFALSSKAEGPDLLVEKDGKCAWLELITPEPTGLPVEWTAPSAVGGVQAYPHREMLLRWTAAIKEKAAKGRHYADLGIVEKGEPYVIVVNDILLGPGYDHLYGISQKPFVVEATLAVGPVKVTIDRNTMEVLETAHVHRPAVLNNNHANVPADTFFDPAYEHVSAVIGTTLGMGQVAHDRWRSIIVHNPLAVDPLPKGFIPVEETWVCDLKPNEYTVRQLP